MSTARDWARIRVIAALGTTQTIAWASSYYLVAIVADPMAKGLSVAPATIFAAFSVALLLGAALGPRVGRTIDLIGGREVLAISNVLFASGLMVLALAQGVATMWFGWLIMGVAIALGLYDAAFATLGRIYGESARSAITGITLIAGFASTVGWPLSSLGVEYFGWRGTCLAWAAVNLALALPANLWMLPRITRAEPDQAEAEPAKPVRMDHAMWLIGFAFAAGWFVAAAMGAHMPRLLEAAGATKSQAVLAGALFGPTQVVARIIEARFFGRFHPLTSARACMLVHPIGAALLLAGGGLLAMPYAMLHGAGNGILTIARGTVPLAVFGAQNYGHRLGLLGAPARMAQACAPLAFAALISVSWQLATLVAAILCLMASLALFAVPRRMP